MTVNILEQFYMAERSKFQLQAWQGTILEDKRDATRTNFRRNRYYDPASGRFTQEDPIGLAGGLNLYGFAGGDPGNFSDPFGLCTLGKDCWKTIKEWSHSQEGGMAIMLAGMTFAESSMDGSGSTVGMAESALFASERMTLQASGKAHQAQEAAAAAGQSWTTQRRAFWRTEANAENASTYWGSANVSRMNRGLAPQLPDATGFLRSVELHHSPFPRRNGGTTVVPVTVDQHKLLDPFRN